MESRYWLLGINSTDLIGMIARRQLSDIRPARVDRRGWCITADADDAEIAAKQVAIPRHVTIDIGIATAPDEVNLPTCTSYAWTISQSRRKNALLLANSDQDRPASVLGRLAKELLWLGIGTVRTEEGNAAMEN